MSSSQRQQQTAAAGRTDKTCLGCHVGNYDEDDGTKREGVNAHDDDEITGDDEKSHLGCAQLCGVYRNLVIFQNDSERGSAPEIQRSGGEGGG